MCAARAATHSVSTRWELRGVFPAIRQVRIEDQDQCWPQPQRPNRAGSATQRAVNEDPRAEPIRTTSPSVTGNPVDRWLVCVIHSPPPRPPGHPASGQVNGMLRWTG
jgi:hypothetical protein